MNDLEQVLSSLLRRYMPALLADSVLRRAQASLQIPEGKLAPEDVRRLAEHLAAGIKLFVSPQVQPEVLDEIRKLVVAPSAPTPAKIPIEADVDVTRARRCAHELASKLGASSFASQRAATATSELARNIVNYAGNGTIELIPNTAGAKPHITVRATDTGPGIANVEAVLSGSYQSKTGLGRGLLGVKQLARRFDIRTTAKGTVVEADIPI